MQICRIKFIFIWLICLAFVTTVGAGEKEVKSYGVCEIIPMNTHGAFNFPFFPELYADNLMPLSLTPDVLHELDGGYPSGEAIGQLDKWRDSLKLTIIRAPQHGSIFAGNTGYLQEDNFIGKDRVDLQIEGKDLNGKLISANIIYYINIVPWEKYHSFADTEESYAQYLKKYCGTTKKSWHISSKLKSQAFYPSRINHNELMISRTADIFWQSGLPPNKALKSFASLTGTACRGPLA